MPKTDCIRTRRVHEAFISCPELLKTIVALVNCTIQLAICLPGLAKDIIIITILRHVGKVARNTSAFGACHKHELQRNIGKHITKFCGPGKLMGLKT